MYRIFSTFNRFRNRYPKAMMVLLVYIIIPVAVGAALGYEMHDDSPATVATVVVDHDRSGFSSDFVDYVDATDTFDVQYYADSDAEAERLIQEGKVFAGLIIPDDFYRDMRSGKAPDILMIYDASSLTVMSVSKMSLTEIMMTMKGAYMKNIFAGKLNVLPSQIMNEVQPVSVTYRNLFNPTKSFRYYLLPGILCAVIQVGISMMGAERGFEVRGEAFSAADILRVILWALVGGLSVMLCLGVQFVCFGLPYRGTLIGGVLLIMAYSLTITTLGYIIGTIMADRMMSVQISAVMVLPTSILGGYTYPVTAMPDFFQKLSVWLPYTYLGNDVRSLCLKEMKIEHIMPHIIFLVKYAAAELVILAAVKLIRDIFRGISEGKKAPN